MSLQGSHQMETLSHPTEGFWYFKVQTWQTTLKFKSESDFFFSCVFVCFKRFCCSRAAQTNGNDVVIHCENIDRWQTTNRQNLIISTTLGTTNSKTSPPLWTVHFAPQQQYCPNIAAGLWRRRIWKIWQPRNLSTPSFALRVLEALSCGEDVERPDAHARSLFVLHRPRQLCLR